MDRIATATKKAWAIVMLLASTLLSYAKIVGVVVSERLWRIPPRHLRTAGDLAHGAGRRMS
jgi:hypothetical protein